MLDRETDRSEEQAPEGTEEALQAVCFELDGRAFGLPIEQVAEVVDLPPLTPVFQMPEWVLGLVGLRGDILEVLDLGPLLGLRPTRVSATARLVVVRAAERRWAVLVDRVEGTRMLERLPPVGGGQTALPGWAAHLGRAGDYVATLLDMEQFARQLAGETSEASGPAVRGGR